MSEELEDKISEDGLRYVTKRSGPSFSPITASSYATISCVFCGVHRGASQRRHQRVLGRAQWVCDPPCHKNPLSRAKTPSDDSN